jgi:hypothetical protein
MFVGEGVLILKSEGDGVAEATDRYELSMFGGQLIYLDLDNRSLADCFFRVNRSSTS